MSSVAATAAVAVACGASTQAAPPQESTATASEAVVAKSCQALDVSASFTDPTNGGSSSFAIDTSGNVYGWGYNGAPHPLGFDNGISAITSPVALGIKQASSIAAHGTGVCAITNPAGAAGSVVCAGAPLGSSGQTSFGPTPGQANVAVSTLNADGVTQTPLTGAVGITAGISHACIWKADGTAWCWGSDYNGQFGDGTDPAGGWVQSGTTFAVPMLDPSGNPLTDVVQVAAAASTTCVLHKTGAINCAGSNAAGERGEAGGATNGTPDGLFSTLSIDPSIKFGSIYSGGGALQGVSAGGTFCASTALPAGGTVQTTYCWGYNANAQALIGSTSTVAAPRSVSSSVGSGWSQGSLDACEVAADGSVKCWGVNTSGEILGAPSSTQVLAETAVSGVAGAYKVAIAHEHMCALTNTGLLCWGDNGAGELGNGTTTAVTTPVDVRLSVPAPVCPANSCGTLPKNACGEAASCGDCNGLVTSGSSLCVNNQCQTNPNYCGPNACPTGQFCSNRVCVAYCDENDISAASAGTTVTMTTSGFNVTSPANYGSANCSSEYIIDIKKMDFYYGSKAIVSPSGAISQADCPNTRVSMTTYANGKQVSAIGPIVGVWNPGGGIIGAYCNFAGNNYGNEMGLPMGSGITEARVAASAERSSVSKGSTVWGTIPVNVYLPPFLH